VGKLSVAVGERANQTDHNGYEEKMLRCDEPTDQKGMLVLAVFHQRDFRLFAGKLSAATHMDRKLVNPQAQILQNSL
jgi:hypothetical protein